MSYTSKLVKSEVVARFPWTSVKRAVHRISWPTLASQPDTESESFDIWQWNAYKMKWVRLSNTACGFGTLNDASVTARQLSDEMQTMFDNNRQPPEPMR